MTEKRFTIRDGFINGLYTIDDVEKEYTFSTLNDKEKLICFSNALNKQYETITRLEKENEQLKSEINMLKTTIGRNEGYIDRLTHKGRWR